MTAVIRILVVDDHTLFRRGLTALLQTQAQFQVVGEAGDAGEALRRAAELQPDVVLLDNHLPGVNGVDALQGLREAAPQAKVLMLTVSEDGHDAGQRAASGRQRLPAQDGGQRRAGGGHPARGAGPIHHQPRDDRPPGQRLPVDEAPQMTADGTAVTGRPGAKPVPARTPDPGRDRAWCQQQGDRPHAGHRRSHGEDPRAAHPAQAQPQFARAGGGVCGGARSLAAFALLRQATMGGFGIHGQTPFLQVQ
jgi:CheY-like chemotaxis protein